MKRLFDISFFLFLLFLPTQFGKHFWPAFSLVLGRRVDYLSPTLYLTDVLFIICVGLFFFIKKGAFINFKILKWSLFIFALAFINSIFSSIPLLSFYGWLRVVEILMLVYLIKIVRPKITFVLMALVIGIAFEAGLIITQFLTQRSLQGIFYFLGERRFDAASIEVAHLVTYGKLLIRPYGTFSHPNIFGGYFLVLSPLFWSFKPKTKIYYMIKWLGMWCVFIGIVLSFSRLAWIFGIFMILFYFLKKPKARVLILSVITIVLLEEIFIGRIFQLSQIDSVSITQRWDLFTGAWQIFLSSPLNGHGLLSFIPQYVSVSRPPYLMQPVHSLPMLILSETGVLGICLFVWAGKNIISQKLKPAFIVSLLLIFGLGLFDHYFFTQQQTRLLLGIIVGLTLVKYDSGIIEA